MAVSKSFTLLAVNLPRPLLITLAPVVVCFALAAIVRVYTTSRYRLSLLSKDSKATAPPPVPYTIPWLGHAISFLAPRPGEFWAQLFRYHPRATGACTLHLGGQDIHILFSPSAVEALFKTRRLAHHGFSQQITELGFGIEHKQAKRYFGLGEGPGDDGLTPLQYQEKVNQNYLLEKKSVNELTAEFVRVLSHTFATELEDGEEKEVGLRDWLQDRMFKASTNALMGSRLLETYPTLKKDFFEFDRYMLTMFFRIPKFLSPTAYNVRERTLSGLVKWQEQMQKECNDEVAHPDGDVGWEPIYGSRANRARQRYYADRGLNNRTRAGMDLGFLFGLSSNAIPAVGWMIMHIVNPLGDATLLPRVMDELKTARRDDGSLDIPILVSLPLLQSIFHETLRLYVDVLVTRELKEDLTLPIDANSQRRVLLEKDAVVMAPSWLGHRDEALWTEPPCNIFHAERFLKHDSESGKQIFSTADTNGKFFPFGGGKTICPGRVFAKQEVLASVAAVLLTFEVTPLGFVDEDGKETEKFPELRKAFAGSGIMATDGDMMVKIRERRKA